MQIIELKYLCVAISGKQVGSNVELEAREILPDGEINWRPITVRSVDLAEAASEAARMAVALSQKIRRLRGA